LYLQSIAISGVVHQFMNYPLVIDDPNLIKVAPALLLEFRVQHATGLIPTGLPEHLFEREYLAAVSELFHLVVKFGGEAGAGAGKKNNRSERGKFYQFHDRLALYF
jgi:hypothetical protein